MQMKKVGDIMKIVECLKAACSLLREKIQTFQSWLMEQGRQVGDQALAWAKEFLTGPLTEVEYAFLKGVSGIVGTALAIYIILIAGLETAMLVFGLCVLFSYVVHRIGRQDREHNQAA